MSSSHHHWGDISDGQVESRIENAVAKLRKHDVFDVQETSDDDERYLLVNDLPDN